jgi:hypothetical protein
MQMLEKDREQLIANVNAINGALQDCEFWLAELNSLKGDSDGNQEETEGTQGSPGTLRSA